MIRRSVFTGCALAVLMAGVADHAAAAAPKRDGDRWALLVGVDDYTQAGKLQYCGADQRALRGKLVAASFPDEQVLLLDDTAAQSRFRPLKANIERQVDGVLRSADEGDVVVLSFSGHGTEIDRKMYFVAGDGDPSDPATLVSLDTVYERLRECPAAVKLVIVDACRNDLRRGAKSTQAADGARALAASLEKKPLPEGVVLLASCAPGEVSWEDDTFRHGVFMHYVLEGLDGKAEADGDGAVSLNELAKYAARHTKAFALKEKSVTQRPYLRNEGEADLLDYALLPVAGGEVRNSLGMRLVRIPAGEFQMGSGETADQLKAAGIATPDGFDSSDEAAVHRVRITKPLFMGAYEVTLGQFLKFYHDGHEGKLDCETDGWGGFGYTGEQGKEFEQRAVFRPWSWGHPNQTNDHPVVNVSWNDATAFCEWLSRKEKKRYRLPTEAEWEYACRAGAGTRFWNGDDPEGVTAVGNVADGTAKAKFPWWKGTSDSRDGHAFTAPVGSFRANAFGLHDMHGNVFEWCSDWYDADYYKQFTGRPAIDPQGASAGSFRVFRGGSWNFYPVYCRSADRGHGTPSYRVLNIGFRVVCELE